MSILPAIAILLQTAPRPVSPCEKLLTQFYDNEDSFAFVHGLNEQSIAGARKFATATGDTSSLSKELRDSEAMDERVRTQGDRILSSLTANKCPVPDHVTSPYTFKRENEACQAAHGTSTEASACDYVARAVKATLAPVRPTVSKRKAG